MFNPKTKVIFLAVFGAFISTGGAARSKPIVQKKGLTIEQMDKLMKEQHKNHMAKRGNLKPKKTSHFSLSNEDMADLENQQHVREGVPLKIGKVLPTKPQDGLVITEEDLQASPDGSKRAMLRVETQKDAQRLRLILDYIIPNQCSLEAVGDRESFVLVKRGKVGVGNLSKETKQVTGSTQGSWTELVLTCPGGGGIFERIKVYIRDVVIIVGGVKGNKNNIRARELAHQHCWDTWDPCVENYMCMEPTDDVWFRPPADNVNEAMAIAKSETVSSSVWTCTIGLIAPTKEGCGHTLALSANHCFDDFTASELGSAEFFFGFHTHDCEESSIGFDCDSHTSAVVMGASKLISGADGDYCLLDLHGDLPSEAVFMPFDTDRVQAPQKLRRLGHPHWGPLAFSSHLYQGTPDYSCLSLPPNQFIYSRDAPYYCLTSTCVGFTMGGSSGSPVFNEDGEIVGQLYGACGYGFECGDNYYTVDGMLNYSYPNIEQWLDPQCCADSDCIQLGESCVHPSCTLCKDCAEGNCEANGCTWNPPVVCPSCATSGCSTCNSEEECRSAGCNYKPQNNRCVGAPSCVSQGGTCEGVSFAPYCAAGCVEDADCPPDKEFCKIEQRICVHCIQANHCDAPAECNEFSNECCQPDTPYYSSDSYQCVQCLNDGHCATEETCSSGSCVLPPPPAMCADQQKRNDCVELNPCCCWRQSGPTKSCSYDCPCLP